MPTSIVYELMTSDVITISKNAKVSMAIEKLASNNISSLVVEDENIPLGIITERDIARVITTLSDVSTIDNISVSEIMSSNPVTIYRNADIITALDKMERNRIRRLIVTDKNGRLNGIITYSDILKKLEESFFKVHTTIDTVMTGGIIKIAPDVSLKAAIDKMSSGKKSCLLVATDDITTGILTERDIVKLLCKKTPLDTPVGDVCTKNIIYVNHDTLLYDAMRIMNERNIRHMIVVSNNLQLIGIVTQTDIINLLHENVTKGIKDHLHKFKESLDFLNTGFIEFELNEEGTILYLSKFGAKELGFESVDSAIGKSFAELLANRQQWKDFLESISNKKTANFIFQTKYKILDGSFKISKFTANGIFKDITDRFIESENIKREKVRFENILKTLSEGVIICNNEGVVQDINQTALNIFGMSKDEILGKQFQQLRITITDDTGDILNSDDLYISKVIDKKSVIKNVIRGIRKIDGTVTWVTSSITPIFDENNQIKEVVHILTDITDLYNLEKRNQRILEAAREGYWEVDLDGKIIKINKALCNLLGYSVEELLDKSIYDLVDEENKAIFDEALKRRKKGVSESYEITLRHKNGHDIFAIVSASPQIDSAGKVFGAFAFITDVTELKSAHNVLHIIASFYRDITRALTETEAYEILKHYLLFLKKGEARIDAFYLVNIDSSKHFTEDVIRYNESGLQEINKFPGIDKCKAYIYTSPFLINDLSKEYACPFQRLNAKTGSYYCIPISIEGTNTAILHLYSKLQNFFTDQIKEAIDSFIALLTPVINNMRLLETNKKLALIDPLTGLYNRRYLEAFIEKQLAIAERNHQPLSIAIVDIDNFKSFNDTHGHEAGDIAMRTISQVITNNIRASDIGVRYGGEEFIIVFPNTDKQAAYEVSERIRSALQLTPIRISADKRAFITASFGIATYGIDSNSLDTLIAKADNALYNAKNNGKNRTCLA